MTEVSKGRTPAGSYCAGMEADAGSMYRREPVRADLAVSIQRGGECAASATGCSSNGSSLTSSRGSGGASTGASSKATAVLADGRASISGGIILAMTRAATGAMSRAATGAVAAGDRGKAGGVGSKGGSAAVAIGGASATTSLGRTGGEYRDNIGSGSMSSGSIGSGSSGTIPGAATGPVKAGRDSAAVDWGSQAGHSFTAGGISRPHSGQIQWNMYSLCGKNAPERLGSLPYLIHPRNLRGVWDCNSAKR